MTAPELSPGSSARPRLVPPSALGYPTILLMVWIVMEFCQLTSPLKIPLMVSIALYLSEISLTRSESISREKSQAATRWLRIDGSGSS